MTTTTNVTPEVLTTEHISVLSSAISKHTTALASNEKVGNLVRKAFIDCSISPLELLPAKSAMYKGRDGVRDAILEMITATFPKYVTTLCNFKASDCEDTEAYRWAEHNISKADRRVVLKAKRTTDEKDDGYRTMKEHRDSWKKQPNSRLNDYRSSLAKALGISLKPEGTVTAGSEAATTEGDEVKIAGNPIGQHATNLLNSLQKNEGDLNITSPQFNAIIKTLTKLAEFVPVPKH